MSSRLGIDVGGTFTDLLLFDERSGAMRLLKTPSTPSDQSVGILNGIQQLIEETGVAASDIAALLHGTTVSTNIVLEAKDRIIIHRDLNKVDPPMVSIEGEVARPGKYPLGEDMTAAQLVQLAGGFKRGAYTERADLTPEDCVWVSGEVSNFARFWIRNH